jgi:hypothetical protein
MIIQLNTDKSIAGNERLENYLNLIISGELSRFSNYITRIEVHLSDENASNEGENDKRCMLEARLQNKQPIGVTCHANTLEKVVNDALDKLKNSMETIIGREKDY